MASYEILSPVPSGEQRKFLALQRGFGNFRKLVVARPVADELRQDDAALRQVIRDARTAALFSHPNLADVFDLETIDGQLYLFTEFIPGASLAEVIRACRHANLRLPLEATLRIIHHAAMGLHYVHHFVDPSGRSMGLLHRQLRDASLIIGFDGLTRVVDLCLPQTAGSAPSPFQAPEQTRGEAPDPRTDVFALGMILKRSLLELKEHAIPTPTIKIPSALEEIANRAVERPRDQRFVNMAELARVCEAAAGRGWEPLQLATLVQRLFQERRAKIAEIVGPSENSKESTARSRLGELFGEGGMGPEASDAVKEATRPSIASPFYRASSDDVDTNPALEGVTPVSGSPQQVRPTRILRPISAARPQPEPRRISARRITVAVLVAAILFGAGAYVMDPAWVTRLLDRASEWVGAL